MLPIDYNTPHICNIVPGNWDLEDNLIAFEENLAYRAFREVYIEGKRWEETLYCDYFKNNYYTDEENIRRRFLYNEFLYNEIKLKGYRSKKLLDYQKSEDLHPESPIHLNDEIRIGIGRKGNLIFIDGNHRLAVVKILACDLIPVRVALAHPTFDLGTFLEHHRAMHPSPEGYS